MRTFCEQFKVSYKKIEVQSKNYQDSLQQEIIKSSEFQKLFKNQNMKAFQYFESV